MSSAIEADYEPDSPRSAQAQGVETFAKTDSKVHASAPVSASEHNEATDITMYVPCITREPISKAQLKVGRKVLG